MHLDDLFTSEIQRQPHLLHTLFQAPTRIIVHNLPLLMATDAAPLNCHQLRGRVIRIPLLIRTHPDHLRLLLREDCHQRLELQDLHQLLLHQIRMHILHRIDLLIPEQLKDMLLNQNILHVALLLLHVGLLLLLWDQPVVDLPLVTLMPSLLMKLLLLVDMLDMIVARQAHTLRRNLLILTLQPAVRVLNLHVVQNMEVLHSMYKDIRCRQTSLDRFVTLASKTTSNKRKLQMCNRNRKFMRSEICSG